MWAWKTWSEGSSAERADGVSVLQLQPSPILFFAPREGTKMQQVIISGVISALIICKQLF